MANMTENILGCTLNFYFAQSLCVHGGGSLTSAADDPRGHFGFTLRDSWWAEQLNTKYAHMSHILCIYISALQWCQSRVSSTFLVWWGINIHLWLQELLRLAASTVISLIYSKPLCVCTVYLYLHICVCVCVCLGFCLPESPITAVSGESLGGRKAARRPRGSVKVPR